MIVNGLDTTARTRVDAQLGVDAWQSPTMPRTRSARDAGAPAWWRGDEAAAQASLQIYREHAR